MPKLTQEDAERLLKLDKDPQVTNIPFDQEQYHIPMLSTDGKEDFVLDVTPSKIKLSKITYQTRARKTIILARLDIAGPPHRNPDDEEIPCPHIHIYREGWGDKWAFPLPEDFHQCKTKFEFLESFCDYCSITFNPFQPPLIP